MSREGIEKLMDRFQNDTTFRQEMATDPAEAVRRSGIDLTDEEMVSLRKMAGSAGEDLKPRISKRPAH
jgi:hypothetical protein